MNNKKYFKMIAEDKFLLYVLILVNIAGTLFGFWYYRFQLPETPFYKMIFVPDCPLYALMFAILMAASTSEAGKIQTGQPGPAITSIFFGSKLRMPKWLMVHSWVPQTWQILIVRVFGVKDLIFSATRLANSGSRKDCDVSI